ncbi:Replication protein A 14 kDa subunit [Apodemus speciosus]|uniref:Replication protein A 14 kDa subunit n=1 Tax=Apodemus speciosus TaxID=105296 RepID=A0ABQ0EU28_APOSI
MVDIMELPKARVNASMLAQYIDRPVCFVGKLEKIHPTGKMFILSDGEGKNGTIELMEPLDEEISGVIEVVGKVTAKATILCSSYIVFKEDCNRFVPQLNNHGLKISRLLKRKYIEMLQLELYNEAVKIINEFPQFFPLGLTQHE